MPADPTRRRELINEMTQESIDMGMYGVPADPSYTPPFVGLPTAGTGCAFGAALDNPPCNAPATDHVLVNSPAWGVVSLASCGSHVGVARACGSVLAEHEYRPTCAREDCWA